MILDQTLLRNGKNKNKVKKNANKPSESKKKKLDFIKIYYFIDVIIYSALLSNEREVLINFIV